ncbi:MAG: hypothetical protein REI11_20595, partial [Patulibacter sp.]|nr:hypothetical protein [Patulibacter sp.]
MTRNGHMIRDAFRLLVGAALLVSGALPSVATASSYSVRSCAASATGNSFAWSRTILQSGALFDVNDWCGTSNGNADFMADYSGALSIRTTTTATSPSPTVAAGTVAELTFAAAVGSHITSLSYRRFLGSADQVFRASLLAGTSTL